MEFLLGGEEAELLPVHGLFSPPHTAFEGSLQKQRGTWVGAGKDSGSCLKQI